MVVITKAITSIILIILPMSFLGLFYLQFKRRDRPGLTRKRCVVMMIIIAAGDAGDAL